MHHNHQAIINMFGGHGPLCLSFEPSDDHTIQDLKVRLSGMTHIDMADQRISTLGGRPLLDEDLLFNDPEGPVILNFSLRLRGGKGGFGSMLRAQGGRMNAQKTTNFEACRDLQGRRIRTVNDAKRREEALAALPEAERERQERIQKKIEDGLKEREPKKFRFDDNQFLEDREEVMESVKSAVSKALKQQPIKKTKVAKAPVVSLLFEDEMSDDDDEEEADAAEASDAQSSKETTRTSTKQERTETATTSESKGKGKGKASAKRSTSSNDDDNDGDSDEEKKDSKKVLSEFMDTNYGDEYDSEEDEDFVDDEEDESSEEEDEEEDFDAEEEEDDEAGQGPAKAAARKGATGGSSSTQSKGKGKQTRKRKEREE